MDLEKNLITETKKWLDRAKEKRKDIMLADETKNNMLKNVDAYISDAQHFLDKKDFIRAFEAVVWGWSIIEIGLELGFFAVKHD